MLYRELALSSGSAVSKTKGAGTTLKFVFCNNSTGMYFAGIGTRLEESLGQIEKVKGYIVIRESSSLTSLNFLKNLKEIEPKLELVLTRPQEQKLELYNDR